MTHDQMLVQDPAVDEEATADLESCGEWPTPWGIEQRTAEVRTEWSEQERADRCAGTSGLPGRADLLVDRQARRPTPEQIREIENSLLAASRAIRTLRPPLSDGPEAYSDFIGELELAIRCPVTTLLGVADLADRKEAVQRMFAAGERESSAPTHRISMARTVKPLEA